MRLHRHAGSRSLFSLAGWLFADLLLVLALIFISANTFGSRPASGARPATPLPIMRTPRTTPILALHYYRFVLQFSDPEKLLHDDQHTIAQIKQQVRAEPQLYGRLAGLVIAYGGAPTPGQISTAIKIAKKVMGVLQSLQFDNYPVFANASYYDPLYLLGSKNTTAKIDVYLFEK